MVARDSGPSPAKRRLRSFLSLARTSQDVFFTVLFYLDFSCPRAVFFLWIYSASSERCLLLVLALVYRGRPVDNLCRSLRLTRTLSVGDAGAMTAPRSRRVPFVLCGMTLNGPSI